MKLRRMLASLEGLALRSSGRDPSRPELPPAQQVPACAPSLIRGDAIMPGVTIPHRHDPLTPSGHSDGGGESRPEEGLGQMLGARARANPVTLPPCPCL